LLLESNEDQPASEDGLPEPAGRQLDLDDEPVGLNRPPEAAARQLDMPAPRFAGSGPYASLDAALDAELETDTTEGEDVTDPSTETEPSTEDSEAAPVELAPKPRRRRSSRRRGSGGGAAAANGAPAPASGNIDDEPGPRHEPHGVTHGDAVFARAASPSQPRR